MQDLTLSFLSFLDPFFPLVGGSLLAIYSDGSLTVVIAITFLVLSGFCYYRYRGARVFSKYL